jgi:hypothetical protein
MEQLLYKNSVPKREQLHCGVRRQDWRTKKDFFKTGLQLQL